MKKIISILLAAAVLFSFAACTQDLVFPENTDKDVLSVTLESAPDYIVGETLNPAAVTLRVVYGDRTEATFTGEQLGMVPAADSSFTLTATNSFSVNYGKEGTTPWTISVKAYPIDKLTVDPSGAAKTVEKSNASATVSTTGLKYTASFNNGQAREVSKDVVLANFEDLKFTVDASAVKKGVTVSADGSDKTKVTISPAWVVDIVEAVDKAKAVDVAIIQVTEKDKDSVIDASEDAGSFEVYKDNGTTSTLADLTLNAVVTNGNGDKATIRLEANTAGTGYEGTYNTTDKISVIWNQYVNDQTLGAASYTATVTVSGADNKAYYTDKTESIAVTYTEDYPVEATITGEATGSTISEKNFNMTVSEWASGRTADEKTYDLSAYDLTLPFNQTYVTAGSGEKVDVTFKYNGEGKKISTLAGEYTVK